MPTADQLIDALRLLSPAVTTVLLISLKIALLVGVVWLAGRLLRGASAAVRHWTWALALASILLLPAIAWLLPEWSVPLLPPATEQVAAPAPAAQVAPAPPVTLPAAPHEVAPVPAPSPAPAAASSEGASGLPWLFLLWGAGAAATAAYFLVGRLQLLWWSRSSAPADLPQWNALLDELSWQLDLRRSVSLRWSAEASTPLTFGTLRPTVLLPLSAASWTPERRRVVLLHELAHVKRFDALLQLIAQLACVLHWFNPAVWFAAHQMRHERERACDDQVLLSGTKASAYAEHLLEVARSLRRMPAEPAGAVAMARPSELEGRLLAILQPDTARRHLRASARAATALAFGGAAFLLAALTPAPRAADLPPLPATASVSALPAPVQPPEFSAAPQSSVAFADDRRAVIRRTFEVEAGGELQIDTDRGSIEIQSHRSPRVQIAVTVESEDDNPLDHYEVDFDHDGADVDIEGRTRDRNASSWNDLHVRYEVTVPYEYDLNLSTSGGSIAVRDLRGEVDAQTAGGSLTFGRIDGPVSAHTSGGSITLNESTSDAELHTSGGSITVGDVRGDVEAHTSGGSVTLGKVKGTVEAHTAGGSISVTEVGGEIDARTAGGSIEARLTRQPRGNSVLETAAGSITLHLADGIGLDLDAETSQGRIRNDFGPGSERRRDAEIRTQIGGGGPQMSLSTSVGDIYIRRIGSESGMRRDAGKDDDFDVQVNVETSRN